MNGSTRTRYSGGTSTAYSPMVRTPKKDNRAPARIVIGLILLIALPPLGVMYIWKAGLFPAALRVLLTALSCVWLGAIFYLGMPTDRIQPISPTPVTPSRVTAAADAGEVNALDSIDQLLDLADSAAIAPAPEETISEEQQQILDAEAARQEAILSTIVYAVAEDAKYYHVANTCRDQDNPRQLTIGQAIDEGLSPCGRCNPPRL